MVSDSSLAPKMCIKTFINYHWNIYVWDYGNLVVWLTLYQ